MKNLIFYCSLLFLISCSPQTEDWTVKKYEAEGNSYTLLSSESYSILVNEAGPKETEPTLIIFNVPKKHFDGGLDFGECYNCWYEYARCITAGRTHCHEIEELCNALCEIEKGSTVIYVPKK